MGAEASLEFVSCNLCGLNSARAYLKLNGYTIVKCRRCGLIYQNPRLKEKKLHEIYDKNYYHNPVFKGKKTTFFGYGEYLREKDDIRATFNLRLKWINRYAKKGKLLDIGCALGFFLELAREQGWKVEGLELADYAYSYTKKVLKIPVQKKTLEQVKFPSGSFDAITLFDVIEHLPDPKRTVAEMGRVLKKGGVISITTPNIGSVVARLLGKNWEEVRRVREHIYFFSEETLRKMLESLGFEILRVETAGRYFSIGVAMERGKLYNKLIFSLLGALSSSLGIDKRKVFVDPRYKVTIYARKR